jgi:hypothetical protein
VVIESPWRWRYQGEMPGRLETVANQIREALDRVDIDAVEMDGDSELTSVLTTDKCFGRRSAVRVSKKSTW